MPGHVLVGQDHTMSFDAPTTRTKVSMLEFADRDLGYLYPLPQRNGHAPDLCGTQADHNTVGCQILGSLSQERFIR